MDVRLNPSVIMREDHFGGICYVPHRDDFFAIDRPIFRLLGSLTHEWKDATPEYAKSFGALARLGICEVRSPSIAEVAYSGPSFVGAFHEIATVREPLVLNCFATAFCPLRCRYCHADDLMQQFRDLERDEDIANVAATAASIPAIVAVITGGDPLTRPLRATRLIESLGSQKALVLDTSGVGDIESLLPVITRHRVHVRVSLDAISPTNAELRPPNPAFSKDKNASFNGALRTIDLCATQDVGVTVQTVITSKNDRVIELMQLRDWLVERGVRHWVLHITVKGGSARRIEEVARKKKRGHIVPPIPEVYDRLKQLLVDTKAKNVPIDIRCTDTGNTPNSVLLVGSNGDLYTEGLAHNGKVLLFTAGDARPDLIRDSWHYLDAFGHARRYLNWNSWFYEGEDLQSHCYHVPLPPENAERHLGVVEMEAKYRVSDVVSLDALLAMHAKQTTSAIFQRDEYYDTPNKALDGQDFVVRLRSDGTDAVDVAIKGPRFRTPSQEYSRIEIELEGKSLEGARASLTTRGLQRTWVFEKRRARFQWNSNSAAVYVDEIPELGFFVEVEGSRLEIQQIEKSLKRALGGKESRNYKEIVVAHKSAIGIPENEVHGAEFAPV
jgi:predicted adenylyl cyclase CyaB